MTSSVTFLREIPVELPPSEGSSSASDSKLSTFCNSARLSSLIWALGQHTFFRSCADTTTITAKLRLSWNLVMEVGGDSSRHTFLVLSFRMPTSNQILWPLTHIRLPNATLTATWPFSPVILHPSPFSVVASTGSALGARTTPGLRYGRTTMLL